MAKVIKDKKARRRINAFDVMIILLALCLVTALGYRVYRGISTPDVTKDSKYVVEFECNEVPNSIVDYVKNEDAVYFAKNGEILGHIYLGKGAVSPIELITEGEEVAPEEETDTGELAEDFFYNVKGNACGKLKLNSDAIVSADGKYFTVGDIGFTVGSTIEVYTLNAVFTIKVTGVQSLE